MSLQMITEETVLTRGNGQLSDGEVKKLLGIWKTDMACKTEWLISFIVNDIRKTHKNAKAMPQEKRNELRRLVVGSLDGLVKAGTVEKILDKNGKVKKGWYVKRSKKTVSRKAK